MLIRRLLVILATVWLMHIQPITAQSADWPLSFTQVLVGPVSNTGPSITSFNGNLYYAITGTNNFIYITKSSDGANWLPDTPLINITQTTQPPRLVSFNNRLYLAVVALNNLNIYLYSSADGYIWDSFVVIPGAAIYLPPSLAVFNNKLYMVLTGANNLMYVTSSSDGFNFPPSLTRILGAVETSGAPTATVFNNILYVSIRGITQNIYVASTSDGVNWSGVTKIIDGVQLIAESNPVLATFNNSLYLSVVYTDQRIYVLNSPDGMTWSQSATSNKKLPGIANYSPSMAIFNNKLYLAVIGTDHRMYMISTVCPAGTAGDGLGPCTPCSAGTYASSPGQTSCQVCPKGYYASSTGQTSCQACSTGFYTNTTRPTSCTRLCPAGTYYYSTASDDSFLFTCVPCPYAFICPITSTRPISCPLGTFPDVRSTVCVPCPPGSDRSSSYRSCRTCGPNSYAPYFGTVLCGTCMNNVYQFNASDCSHYVSGSDPALDAIYEIENSTATLQYGLVKVHGYTKDLLAFTETAKIAEDVGDAATAQEANYAAQTITKILTRVDVVNIIKGAAAAVEEGKQVLTRQCTNSTNSTNSTNN